MEYYYCLEIEKKDPTLNLKSVLRTGGFISNSNCRIDITSTPEKIEWSGHSFLNGSAEKISSLLKADSNSPLLSGVVYNENVHLYFDNENQVNIYFTDSATGWKESHFSYRVLLTGNTIEDEKRYTEAFIRLVKCFYMFEYPVF
jgi:hypothetical protein